MESGTGGPLVIFVILIGLKHGRGYLKISQPSPHKFHIPNSVPLGLSTFRVNSRVSPPSLLPIRHLVTSTISPFTITPCPDLIVTQPFRGIVPSWSRVIRKQKCRLLTYLGCLCAVLTRSWHRLQVT